MGSSFPHLHLSSFPLLHAIKHSVLKILYMITRLSKQNVFISFLYPTTGMALCLRGVRPGETASGPEGCPLALQQHQSKAEMHWRQQRVLYATSTMPFCGFPS